MIPFITMLPEHEFYNMGVPYTSQSFVQKHSFLEAIQPF